VLYKYLHVYHFIYSGQGNTTCPRSTTAPQSLGPSLHIGSSPLPVHRHELTWPSSLSSTVSKLNTCTHHKPTNMLHNNHTPTMVSNKHWTKLWSSLNNHLALITHEHIWLEMATGTRNPSTRRVLPDKEAGMEWIFYPWVRYWTKSYTHRVCGYGCGCILPIPAYPRVRHTRKNN
jgi:hypothetical protein